MQFACSQIPILCNGTCVALYSLSGSVGRHVQRPAVHPETSQRLSGSPAKSGGAAAPQTLSRNLWRASLKGMAFPVGLLAFFSAAPAWLNYRVHESIESTIERSTLAAPQKTSRLRELAGIDFSRLERGAYPGRYASLRANLESTGIGPRFRRLEWGIRLSALLVGIFLAFFGTTLAMSRRARR